eukprot:TRINITY_DN10216_c0_g1_i4.p1 TRINITY_DN10216_c0_g1~~TRINITY_DN10216_c0_g1_i4.p1  ORF type:complete len:571 (+),score=93.14 TRINITY_DN10216_c0_g1_i4:1072-2784(+)
MMKRYGWTTETAYEYMLSKQPDILIKPAQMRQLKALEERLRKSGVNLLTFESPFDASTEDPEGFIVRMTYVNAKLVEPGSSTPSTPTRRDSQKRRLLWADTSGKPLLDQLDFEQDEPLSTTDGLSPIRADNQGKVVKPIIKRNGPTNPAVTPTSRKPVTIKPEAPALRPQTSDSKLAAKLHQAQLQAQMHSQAPTLGSSNHSITSSSSQGLVQASDSSENLFVRAKSGAHGSANSTNGDKGDPSIEEESLDDSEDEGDGSSTNSSAIPLFLLDKLNMHGSQTNMDAKHKQPGSGGTSTTNTSLGSSLASGPGISSSATSSTPTPSSFLSSSFPVPSSAPTASSLATMGASGAPIGPSANMRRSIFEDRRSNGDQSGGGGSAAAAGERISISQVTDLNAGPSLPRMSAGPSGLSSSFSGSSGVSLSSSFGQSSSSTMGSTTGPSSSSSAIASAITGSGFSSSGNPSSSLSTTYPSPGSSGAGPTRRAYGVSPQTSILSVRPINIVPPAANTKGRPQSASNKKPASRPTSSRPRQSYSPGTLSSNTPASSGSGYGYGSSRYSFLSYGSSSYK